MEDKVAVARILFNAICYPGCDYHRMAILIELPYKNLNRRAARLVEEYLYGLVTTDKIGNRSFFYPITDLSIPQAFEVLRSRGIGGIELCVSQDTRHSSKSHTSCPSDQPASDLMSGLSSSSIIELWLQAIMEHLQDNPTVRDKIARDVLSATKQYMPKTMR